MKTVLYLSDIMGTILGSSENSQEDYQKFNELLGRIKEKENADKIIFTLISTDNKETVKKVENLLTPYIKENVTFGRQYFGQGYYTENEQVLEEKTKGKVSQLLEYVEEELQVSEDISIYYAEDTEMNYMMVEVLAEENGWIDKLHSINPSGIGLKETNELLEDNLKKRFGKEK